MGATALKYTYSEEDITCGFWDQPRQIVRRSEVIELFE